MRTVSLIKSTLVVASIALATALFAGPAFTLGTVLPSPDSTPAPPDVIDEPTSAAPLPSEVHSLKVVDIEPDTRPAKQIAVQACVGLYNHKFGGSVYARMKDKDSKWMEELGLKPDQTMNADGFLDACMTEFPACVRYSYDGQQALLPNILTVGAVLEAVPLDEEMDVQCGDMVFDATEEFKERNTPDLATKFVYDNFATDTTGLAMLNPGYDTAEGKVWDPEMTRDMDPAMIDFVFSKKLFVMFLVNGCIEGTQQHSLTAIRDGHSGHDTIFLVYSFSLIELIAPARAGEWV